MSFKAKIKKPGDMIRSSDWNAAIQEIESLGTKKLNLSGGSLSGPLTIKDGLKIGDEDSQLSIDCSQNGLVNIKTKDESDKLILGLGDNQTLTFKDGNVGLGVDEPKDKLEVDGNLNVSGLIKNGTCSDGAWYDHPNEWANQTTSNAYQILTTRKIHLTHNSRLFFFMHGHTNIASGGLHAYVRIDGSIQGTGIHNWVAGTWQQVSYGFISSLNAGEHLIEGIYRNGSGNGALVQLNGIGLSYMVVGSY